MSDMKDLFITDFLVHYHITSCVVANEYEVTDDIFELVDSSGDLVVNVGEGELRMHNILGGMNVFAYDRFIRSCKKPSSFLKGRKCCDIILTSHEEEMLVCLIEITSAVGNTDNLYKPILKKDTDMVLYPGGKVEKAELQLINSLQTIMDVPAIADKLNNMLHKSCVLAYRVLQIDDLEIRLRYPNNRYKLIEAKETGNSGAIISSPMIEEYGFQYRRVAYPTMLQLIN